MGAAYSVTAKPYAFDFDLESAAFVIIDMQRDFLYPEIILQSKGIKAYCLPA